VLRFLEEHEWFADIVVGTSIGAVNGAAIASGHTAHSLWALWQRLRTKDVQKPNLNPISGNFLLDTAPLRETLQREGWVNFDRINSSEAAVHLRVTATEVNTGHLHVFGNSADMYPSKMRQEAIGLDHIIASCSIPIVYPATQLHGHLYWDGATVANTPLGPAIDAGAEEIVVVIMTPWEADEESETETPGNLLSAASTTLEWALLASFQADLKLFRRVNELVNLQVENARLRASNSLLQSQIEGQLVEFEDADGDGIPDILQGKYQALPDPIIIAPRKPIPVDRIISYTREGHEELVEMGYDDARRAWRAAGKQVEGEA
jgi:NTE family protein